MKSKFYLWLCLVMFACINSIAQEVIPGGWITNGAVTSISHNSQNVYVGGSFDLVGKHRPNGVIYDLASSQPIPSASYPSGIVTSSVADGQGGFFIAGTASTSNTAPSFQKVGDVNRAGLAHIMANGSVSLIFNPVLAGGGKAGKTVLAATNDRVIVATRSINAITKAYEARVYCLAYDGTVLWERAADNGSHIDAGAIADGTVYIAGRFLSIEGQARTRAAAIDLVSGNLLPWNTADLIPPLIGNIRRAITIGIGDDEVFLRFNPNAIGVSTLISVDRVTGISTGWGVNVGGGSLLVHNEKLYYQTLNALVIRDAATKAVLPNPDGVNWNTSISSLSAAGNTIYVASTAGFNDPGSNSLGSIVAFNESSLTVQAFDSRLYSGINAAGRALYTMSGGGGRLFVGGSFPSIAMKPVTNLFGYNRQTDEFLPFSPVLNDVVTHVQAFEDRLYINGFFWQVNNADRLYGVASFELPAGQLTDWNPELFATAFAGWNNTLYLTGEIPGRNGIAAFNATTGELTDWNPPNGIQGTQCIADDNGVYVGGNSWGTASIRFYNHVNGNEIFPPVALTPGDNGATVFGMALANNRLFVGGDFAGIGEAGNAVAKPAFGVVDLSTGMPVDHTITFSPALEWGNVSALASDGGSVYIGGYFDAISGQNRKLIGAINAETLLLTDWNAPVDASGAQLSYNFINTIKPLAEGVLIGGEFYKVKEMHTNSLAMVTPDNSNVVSGTVYLDDNGNGTQDVGEEGLSNILVEVQPGNLFYPTDENGQFRFFTGVGDFTINPVHPTYALSVNPSTANVTFTGYLQSNNNLNFAVVPFPSIVNDNIEIISDRCPRPGFEYEYTISYQNMGTVASSGTITVTLDPRLLNEGTEPTPTNVNGNVLEWTYSDLLPAHSGSILIHARVPAPTEEGSLLGEQILTSAIIDTEGDDVDLEDNSVDLEEIVVGSVDPNDKLVTPQGYGPNGYVDEDTEFFTYTIRFQNVGTAPAEDVYIQDAFDVNLDVSSFTVVESSHPNFNYYIQDRTLFVTYPDINLIDSVANEPESHGFITFRINLNSGLPRGTVIQNSAAIVFDYNLPLVTNTVINTLRNAPYPTMIFIPSLETAIGATVDVPVMVRSFNDVAGAQFSVAWDPEVITFESVGQFNLPGLDETSFNLDHADDGFLTVVWNDPTLASHSRPDSSAVFTLQFLVSGLAGTQTEINISQAPVPLEVIGSNFEIVESERLAGSLNVSSQVSLNGVVLYPNGQAVQNVTVGISGSHNGSSQSNQTGHYNFELEPVDTHVEYTLTPSKDDDPEVENGIDVQDVALIRRNILGIETLGSPFAIIAADVSNNQSVSVQDIILLQAFILGVETSFPENRHWTFVDADHDFTAGNSPFSYAQTRTVDFEDLVNNVSHGFTAIKIGDIDFSRDNSQSGRTKHQEVIMEISRPRETAQDWVEVDMKLHGFIDISAFQFTIAWNAEELEWSETFEKNISAQYGKHRVDEGILTVIWDHPKGQSLSLPENDLFATLRFKKNSDAVSQPLTVDGRITKLKMYDMSLRPVDLTIRYGDEEKVESRKFYPNPFDETTTISFSANEPQTGRFEVKDITGKSVDMLDVNVQKGWNEMSYNGARLIRGAYIFTLKLNDRIIRAKAIKR
ncbi:MAG TPA: cohesin domain-containing protein [Chryseosolibacter sp.]